MENGKVDYGLLSDLTDFSLKLSWTLGHALLNRAIGGSGITLHRFSVLEVTGCNPGLQQTRLAAALALSRPATTLAVDFWEERGCLERRNVRGDRRSFGVYLTPRGERELDRLRPLVRKADTMLTGALTEAERADLRRLLKKIHR
jgi:DNA-binding MarR family transcriptional regulator